MSMVEYSEINIFEGEFAMRPSVCGFCGKDPEVKEGFKGHVVLCVNEACEGQAPSKECSRARDAVISWNRMWRRVMATLLPGFDQHQKMYVQSSNKKRK